MQTGTPAISPSPARFRPGDQVYVGRTRGNPQVWTVVAIDTNRTPVRDPEPAYRIRDKNGHNTRYAYESDLLPAEGR